MRTLFLLLATLSFVWAEPDPPYRVVMTDFPYISEINNEGQMIGLGVDVLAEISDLAGFDYTISSVPFKRALRMIEYGQADIFIGPYYSAERAQYMLYNRFPFFSDRLYFYARSEKRLDDTLFNWQSDYSNLRTTDIAVIAGWSYGHNFDLYRNQLSLIEVASVEAGLKMLASGRVDLIAAHDRSLSAARKTLDQTVIIDRLYPAIHANPAYFGFSLKTVNRVFLRSFDNAFETLRSNGRFDALLNKYGISAPMSEDSSFIEKQRIYDATEDDS